MRASERKSPTSLLPNKPTTHASSVHRGPRSPAFMASYFLFDHVGWAAQAGLLTDKALIDRCQKISTWSWLLGSLSTIVIELTGARGCYGVLRVLGPAYAVPWGRSNTASCRRRCRHPADGHPAEGGRVWGGVGRTAQGSGRAGAEVRDAEALRY